MFARKTHKDDWEQRTSNSDESNCLKIDGEQPSACESESLEQTSKLDIDAANERICNDIRASHESLLVDLLYYRRVRMEENG